MFIPACFYLKDAVFTAYIAVASDFYPIAAPRREICAIRVQFV
jgi:hypothetical protein